MPIENTIRLALIAFAVLAVVYVCTGSGLWNKSNSDWWNELPRYKRNLFIAAIAVSILQTFI